MITLLCLVLIMPVMAGKVTCTKICPAWAPSDKPFKCQIKVANQPAGSSIEIIDNYGPSLTVTSYSNPENGKNYQLKNYTVWNFGVWDQQNPSVDIWFAGGNAVYPNKATVLLWNPTLGSFEKQDTCQATTTVPEFPSSVIPEIMIIGFLGAVFYVRRTRGN